MSNYYFKKLEDIKDFRRKRAIFRLLRANYDLKDKRRKKVANMIFLLRKFHTYYFFKKYRRIVSLEVQVREKHNIQGAYILLKRYKNRLKAFDEALGLMD